MRLIGLAVALALGLTLAPMVAETQQARKVWRIGVLAPKEGSALLVDVEGVRRGLKEFGYVEGKNLVIEARGSSRYEELGHAAVEVARASSPMSSSRSLRLHIKRRRPRRQSPSCSRRSLIPSRAASSRAYPIQAAM